MSAEKPVYSKLTGDVIAYGHFEPRQRKDGTMGRKFVLRSAFPKGSAEARNWLNYVNPRIGPSSPSYLGEGTGSTREITRARAEKAQKSWNNKSLRRGKFASRRGARSSMTYDSNRSGERGAVVSNATYLRSPWKYDFDGVDNLGNKPKRPAPAHLAQYQFQRGSPRTAEIAALGHAARRKEYVGKRRAANIAGKKTRRTRSRSPRRRAVRKAGVRKGVKRAAVRRAPRSYASIPSGRLVPAGSADVEAARQAFLAHYTSDKYGSQKAARSAMTRDQNKTRALTADLGTYSAAPNKYDFAGVDTQGSPDWSVWGY